MFLSCNAAVYQMAASLSNIGLTAVYITFQHAHVGNHV